MWNPIESAPKDGTVIDLWLDGRREANCFWDADPEGSYGRACWRQQYSEAPGASFDVHWGEWDAGPTHWKHLPEPPK